MKLLFALLVLAHTTLFAQQAEPLLFKEKIHDFGEIFEQGGPVEYEFTFLNNSGRAIKIINVNASCGCTTPGWSKDIIPQGSKGFVTARFEPKGRPGYFNKSLTVTTDLEGSAIMLQIKGQVISGTQLVADADYPIERGALRFKSASFNLEKVYINTPPLAKEFMVFNSSGKVVHFTEKAIGPAYINVETPTELQPHQKGVIKVTFDAKLKNQFGFVSENVEIGTDDDAQPLKAFAVYATIEEFFPILTIDEYAKAPVFRMQASEIDLGKIAAGNIVEREVAVKNSGKKDLVVRAIQENCSCVTATLPSMKIKAGETAKLKLKFNTTGRVALQQKAVTIYTNDPKNPVQRLSIAAYIEN